MNAVDSTVMVETMSLTATRLASYSSLTKAASHFVAVFVCVSFPLLQRLLARTAIDRLVKSRTRIFLLHLLE